MQRKQKMAQKTKLYLSITIFLCFLGWLVLPGSVATTSAQAVETAGEEYTDLASVIQRQRSLDLVEVSPVVIEDQSLGVIRIYDDPSTKRRGDYIELYDSEGELIAIGWFDQFGIERLAVDRAFIEGTGSFQRIFVRIVDGDFI
jgi:hypothetical protein